MTILAYLPQLQNSESLQAQARSWKGRRNKILTNRKVYSWTVGGSACCRTNLLAMARERKIIPFISEVQRPQSRGLSRMKSTRNKPRNISNQSINPLMHSLQQCLIPCSVEFLIVTSQLMPEHTTTLFAILAGIERKTRRFQGCWLRWIILVFTIVHGF